MDASDDDVITLVYKGESGKNNWGVLGWGAGVDGNWIDSNTVPGLGYSSDATDGANELTVTMTAGELKDAFGITEESTVTAIKLGAWNGGQIVSLSIASEDNTGDSEGDGSTDDGSTDDGSTDDGSTDDGNTDDGNSEEGVVREVKEATYTFTAVEDFAFDLYDYFDTLNKGDTVELVATFTSSTYYGGELGISDLVDGTETWSKVSFDNNTGTASYTATVAYDGSNGGKVALYWIGDSEVELTLTMTRVSVDETKEATYTFTAVEDFAFDLYDYFDSLGKGDTVELVATFTSSTYYGGELGISDLVDGTETWSKVSFDNNTGTASYTATVAYDGSNGGKVALYWIGDAEVELKLTMTKKAK